jgi:hypothetical protein
MGGVRRFDEFLKHGAFSSVEYTPKFYKQRNEHNPHTGYGIQAAIIVAEKGHPFIKQCLEYYHVAVYDINLNFSSAGIAPYVMAKQAEAFGFRYDFDIKKPQHLSENIVIYPPSVFASAYVCADMKSYALHCSAASWHKRGKMSPLLEFYEYLVFNFRFFAMLHYSRKQVLRRLQKKINLLTKITSAFF